MIRSTISLLPLGPSHDLLHGASESEPTSSSLKISFLELMQDIFAWTPLLEPLNGELALVVSTALNIYYLSTKLSRAQRLLWRTELKRTLQNGQMVYHSLFCPFKSTSHEHLVSIKTCYAGWTRLLALTAPTWALQLSLIFSSMFVCSSTRKKMNVLDYFWLSCRTVYNPIRFAIYLLFEPQPHFDFSLAQENNSAISTTSLRR